MQDPILGVTEAFLADKNPDKINLGVVSQICLTSGSACRSCGRGACSTPTWTDLWGA